MTEDAMKKTGLSTVEKLRIAGVVAPTVRRGSNRKVTVVSKSGEPIREMTLDEVQAALVNRKGIEFSAGGEAGAGQTVCAGWDGPCHNARVPPKGAFAPRIVDQRGGDAWRCRSCAIKRHNARMTPEQRSDVSRKSAMARSAEERREAARNAASKMTDRQRAKAVKASAARTPEQRSDGARKAAASRDPKERSASARKAVSTRWENTRRAKAAKPI